MEEAYKRVVMCSGKVYYELAKKRADMKMEKEVAIIRLEQVHAFLRLLSFPVRMCLPCWYSPVGDSTNDKYRHMPVV